MSDVKICAGCGRQLNPFDDGYWHIEFDGNPISTMLMSTNDKDICTRCFIKAMKYLKKEGEENGKSE